MCTLLNFPPGQGWRSQCCAGDLPPRLQPRLPRVRRRRPQTSVWLRGASGDQVHRNILQGAFWPETVHHRYVTQHVILAAVKQLSLSKHWYYCLFTKHKALFIQVRHYGEIHLCLFVSANCCPNLETMFLGSNNPRSLNPGVFRHWPRLAFLTLENIMVENIVHCLEEVGSQLKAWVNILPRGCYDKLFVKNSAK